MVNEPLRKEYETVYNTTEDKKGAFLESISEKAGVKKNLEQLISQAFLHTENDFFTALTRVEVEVRDNKDKSFMSVPYSIVFNDKVLEFLKTSSVLKDIEEYIDTYNKLIDSSTFFRKGVFNHNNASEIAKTLKENGFFKASHSVTVSVNKQLKEIKTEEQLEEIIETEKTHILSDAKLKKSFENIDKKLTKNKELRTFREYLENNKFIITELNNIQSLEQKVWIAYFSQFEESYNDLLKTYGQAKEKISEIFKKAEEEKTSWQTVVDIFNRRFSVPFRVSVRNKKDVITKNDVPSISFEFKENDTVVPIGESELNTVLSNGEKRALYLLNIIFEVEARKSLNQKTLFIIDDIADSFDYKNKYAIMEYLLEMSKVNNFFQIILTHNFDFYRTIGSRLSLPRENRKHTVKTNAKIEIIGEKYQHNPFTTWVNNLEKDPAMLIASIPFLRNIAEYCGDTGTYEYLTVFLHKKAITDTELIANLEIAINAIMPQNKKNLAHFNHAAKVKDLIFSTADSILEDNNEKMDLECKIVLSIAIRLASEEFLISKINDMPWVNKITGNQTAHLIDKYKEKYPQEYGTIDILNRVSLMTSENIHINSFMYEPILDMDSHHLKQLYSDVCGLLSSSKK